MIDLINEKKLSDVKKDIQSRINDGTVVSLYSNPELDKIQPLSYDEIVASSPAPMEYALYPWLPIQGIAFIYAATGVGKTFFTLNAAYTIASGGNFLKYKAPKPRRVLYVDGEMSYVQIYNRFMDIIKQQGELEDKSMWYLLTPDKAKFKLPKICTPEGQEYYSKKVKELGVEVLILDNLSTLSSIDDSNVEQWKVIQDWLVDLRSKGITTIIVHHAGKDKNGYRGTSRMLDCIDTAISLQDVSVDQLETDITSSKKFKIVYQKNRTFDGKDALAFEVTFSPQGWKYESMEKTNLIRIAEMFNNKMRQVNISRELGAKESYVSKIIKQARLKGLIRD